MAKPIPEGFHTITPTLVVKNTKKAIEFYKKAFGAEERGIYETGGMVMHAEIKIGDSILFLSDEAPEMGALSAETLKGSAGNLWIYTKDADALYDRAVKAGAQVKMPMTDMFWGDRFGGVIDPFGFKWGIATHIEDVSKEETKKRGDKFFASMANK